MSENTTAPKDLRNALARLVVRCAGESNARPRGGPRSEGWKPAAKLLGVHFQLVQKATRGERVRSDTVTRLREAMARIGEIVPTPKEEGDGHAHRRLLDMLAGWAEYVEQCAQHPEASPEGPAPEVYERESAWLHDAYQRAGAWEANGAELDRRAYAFVQGELVRFVTLGIEGTEDGSS